MSLLYVLFICFCFTAVYIYCYGCLWGPLQPCPIDSGYVCVGLNSTPGTKICISFLLLPNKLAPTSSLKLYICYLTVSVGQKSRHGLISQGCEVSVGLHSLREFQVLFKFCVVMWQHSVPGGRRTAVFHLLGTSQSLLSASVTSAVTRRVDLPVAFPHMTVYFFKASEGESLNANLPRKNLI